MIAESLLLKHQLLILNRSRNRAPRLTPWDRLLFGIGAFLVASNRLTKIAIGSRPSTLLRFQRALIQRKYRLLLTPRARQRPGPKGPSKDRIAAILDMKHRNPHFGCPRIALEITHVFDVEIDKDVVRRILAQHFRPPSGGDGPSWLTLIGSMKDGLWSVDLFRYESIVLKSYWVTVVMDLFTRRIVGFGVAPTDVDGVAVCRMFNHAISGQPLPKHLSTVSSLEACPTPAPQASPNMTSPPRTGRHRTTRNKTGHAGRRNGRPKADTTAGCGSAQRI